MTAVHLSLGTRRLELSRRPLVVGILNRTRESFHDRGAHFALDAFLERAERLVDDGADVLQVGARPGGVGMREVGDAEETGLVAHSLWHLRERFDLRRGIRDGPPPGQNIVVACRMGRDNERVATGQTRERSRA